MKDISAEQLISDFYYLDMNQKAHPIRKQADNPRLTCLTAENVPEPKRWSQQIPLAASKSSTKYTPIMNRPSPRPKQYRRNIIC